MPGRLNFVADCLSRIETSMGEHNPIPKSLSDFKLRDSEDILAITRNQSRQKDLARDEEPLKPASTTIPDVRRENNPKISERPGTLLTQKGFDRIYYFFNRLNTALQRKLEDRLKIQFKVPDRENKLYRFSVYQAAVWAPESFKTMEAKSALRELLQTIHNQCIEHNHERIAISVNLRDAFDYFELKRLTREIFKNGSVAISIYQNRTIEVTETENINEILKAYHNSLLGGHAGISRYVKRFYNWPTLTEDVKAYVRNCPTCEKTKVNKLTRSPMQIRSTADEPFHKIYIDFVGEINPPSAKGHKYIFTATAT